MRGPAIRSTSSSNAAAVTVAKQLRIRKLAALWLADHDGPWAPIRFDVIEVYAPHGREPSVEHLAGVF